MRDARCGRREEDEGRNPDCGARRLRPQGHETEKRGRAGRQRRVWVGVEERVGAGRELAGSSHLQATSSRQMGEPLTVRSESQPVHVRFTMISP